MSLSINESAMEKAFQSVFGRSAWKLMRSERHAETTLLVECRAVGSVTIDDMAFADSRHPHELLVDHAVRLFDSIHQDERVPKFVRHGADLMAEFEHAERESIRWMERAQKIRAAMNTQVVR